MADDKAGEILVANKSAMVDMGGTVRRRIKAGVTTAHRDADIVAKNPKLWGPIRIDYPATPAPALEPLSADEEAEVRRLVKNHRKEELENIAHGANLDVAGEKEAIAERLVIAARREGEGNPLEPIRPVDPIRDPLANPEIADPGAVIPAAEEVDLEDNEDSDGGRNPAGEGEPNDPAGVANDGDQVDPEATFPPLEEQTMDPVGDLAEFAEKSEPAPNEPDITPTPEDPTRNKSRPDLDPVEDTAKPATRAKAKRQASKAK